jgi:hypothetical protein
MIEASDVLSGVKVNSTEKIDQSAVDTLMAIEAHTGYESYVLHQLSHNTLVGIIEKVYALSKQFNDSHEKK